MTFKDIISIIILMIQKDKKPNPFNPTSVVPHNLFAGRFTQVDNVLKKLSLIKNASPSSFFFVGERGIGKTALARLIKYVSQNRDIDLHNLDLVTSYYSIEKGQTSSEVLQASLNELTDSLDSDILQKLKDHLGGLFKNGKFTIGAFGASIDIEGPERNKNIVNIRDQLISILSNIIKEVRSSDKPKDGILIILDELDNVVDLQNLAQLIRGIVTTLTIKDLGYISFILIGYKDTEYRFFSGDESARRSFDEVYLESMPEDEAKEILIKGFESAEVTWDNDQLENAISRASGYPHLIQILGHNVYDADIDLNIAGPDWMHGVLKTTLELQSKEFASMYNFKGKKGNIETILDILAEEDRFISKSELSSIVEKKKGNKVNIYRTVGDAFKKGSICENNNGEVGISSQLLRYAILFNKKKDN